MRYQQGTVELKRRSQKPDVWVYRWRSQSPEGQTLRHSANLGTVEELRTRAEALRAAEKHRLQANRQNGSNDHSSFGGLIDRYTAEERLLELRDRSRSIGITEEDESFDAECLDPSTSGAYLSILRMHIRPRWEKVPISQVKPAAVQDWLKSLRVAPKTRGHIKALMHRLFEKAMLWEVLPVQRNPMELVHLKGISRRSRRPIVLTAEQCQQLLAELPDPYRMMVLVALCTGLRVGEVLALRWSRIDLAELTMMISLKAVNGRLGRVKTECSEDELPLDPAFAQELASWKQRCRKTIGNWVFPSPITDRPFHASPIQQDYLRPAGRRLGLGEIGWHTFRHTYRTWLDAVGTPIGVQQKLMRHAHPDTTMGYGNALMSSKRDANSKVVQMLLPERPTMERAATAQ